FASLLVIVPGLLVASTLRFYKFLIVEAETDAVVGLRESYELSGSCRGSLVLFTLASAFLKCGGLCCFLVGWIPASAVAGLAEVSIYRHLQAAKTRESQAPTAPNLIKKS